jgi:hypothetical protein
MVSRDGGGGGSMAMMVIDSSFTRVVAAWMVPIPDHRYRQKTSAKKVVQV